MRPLKNFDEFLKDGVVRKRKPDIPRSKSLIEESEKRMKFLKEVAEKIKVTDDNANFFIENSYDVLIELIRARMLSDGFTASGKGAHEAEVSYMKKFDFSESEIRFMNELTYFRNRILYYGKDFDKPYANKVPKYLMEHGYKVIPVNPFADEILGLKCYKNLSDVKKEVGVVDIFRPSKEVLGIVKEAIKMKAKVVWMQKEIVNNQAAEIARKAGLRVIMDKCIMLEHKKLFHQRK